ncbi:uncharacterized protein LOC129619077 [Condylostylus longicornis]|uniref:uncharacterized protein LOC129619077 n=1 Tax=Condylostylus longicornis TaxID=2530218 RepID=UPI00244E0B61|nr:uncharacterized protein LOC129619077 [Condylostylus longicornis]
MLKILIKLLFFILLKKALAGDSENIYIYQEEEVTKCLVDDVHFEPGIYKKPFPNKCMYIYCTPDGIATIATCPQHVNPPKDCEHGQYLYPNGDYPKCCRKEIICKEDI